MNEVDTQKEWRKLAEAYAGMSDEELGSLADQAYDLTDMAKQALQAEAATRGLRVVLAKTPLPATESGEDRPREDFDPEELNLVSVNRVWEASEARDIMKALYDGGIPAYLGPENVEDVDKFHGDFEAGVDIRVRAVDRQRAGATLAGASPKADDDVPKEEQYIARCPKCHSEEIVFEELVPAAETTESAHTDKFLWKCDACGHEWEDDGVEGEQPAR